MRHRIALSLWIGGLALAQHHTAPPAEKPVALLAGLGTWRHPIATSNPEAQKFFDQGLTLLYGFNRYEAWRSFRKASELDPQAAMPWWGMAMARGPHINMDMDGDVDTKASCEAATGGLRLTGAPAVERAYLESVAIRCQEPQGYIAAMRRLAASYPDDPDAAVAYAESLLVPTRWHWYASDGTAAQGVAEAERVLERVMRRFPDHPGANHFYIHAVESSPTPERAIASAQRLMGVVPAAGHLVHMPGHIWMVLGDYQTVADVNERAAELDRRYLAETGVQSVYIGYYVHNLDFLLAARLMQGHTEDAVRASEALRAAMMPMVDMMPEMLDPFVELPLLTRVRFNLWDEVLQAPAPDAKFPAATAMYHYSRATAFAARGERAHALKERDAFEAARKKMPADRAWGNNTAASLLELAGEVVAARVAESPADAVPHWKRAATIQDGLVYDEPPDWYYPVRESLGGALLRAGRAAEAEAAFREGLRRAPRDGRMLFGLRESLKAQKKSDAAAWVEQEFEAAWRGMDVNLRVEDL